MSTIINIYYYLYATLKSDIIYIEDESFNEHNILKGKWKKTIKCALRVIMFQLLKFVVLVFEVGN